jgi:hypothetical protein
MIRRFRLGLIGVAAAASLMNVQCAAAETPADYVELFKSKIFPCLHPTVKMDSVTVEVRKEPSTAGDITTTRLEAFYSGLIKKNSLQADVMIRQAGSIKQLKVKVLDDTSVLHGFCDLTADWKDF